MDDPLADWMKVTRSHGTLLASSELPERWGFRIDGGAAASFHILLRGEAWLRLADRAPLRLREGAIAVLPRGPQHIIASSPEAPAVPLAELGPLPAHVPRPTQLLCGEYSAGRSASASVWRGLPPVIHLRAEVVAGDAHLRAVLELIARELSEPGEGADPLIGHLLDALMVYLLRAWARTSACGGGWLGGLSDPILAAPLRLIHERPERPWTVASLAGVAGVSRAVFAKRFTERMGEPPMAYLRRWRMSMAAALLERGNSSLSEVAERVGYTSEFAFNRAFKRVIGESPGRWRRRVLGADAAGAERVHSVRRSP